MAARCGTEGVSRSTRTRPASVVGNGAIFGGAAAVGAFFADAAFVCGLPDAVSAARTSRLNKRAGIIFAKQVRIVMCQGSHQLHMDVIHHAGTWGEIRLEKGYTRGIDARAQGSIEVSLGASRLHGRG